MHGASYGVTEFNLKVERVVWAVALKRRHRVGYFPGTALPVQRRGGPGSAVHRLRVPAVRQKALLLRRTHVAMGRRKNFLHLRRFIGLIQWTQEPKAYRCSARTLRMSRGLEVAVKHIKDGVGVWQRDSGKGPTDWGRCSVLRTVPTLTPHALSP